MIKELQMKCSEYESELDKSHDANLQLIELNHSLEKVKIKFNFNFLSFHSFNLNL